MISYVCVLQFYYGKRGKERGIVRSHKTVAMATSTTLTCSASPTQAGLLHHCHTTTNNYGNTVWYSPCQTATNVLVIRG